MLIVSATHPPIAIHLCLVTRMCKYISWVQWNCIPVPGLGITSFRRPRHSRARKWQGRDGSGNRIHREMDRINRSIRLHSNLMLVFYFLCRKADFKILFRILNYNAYRQRIFKLCPYAYGIMNISHSIITFAASTQRQ